MRVPTERQYRLLRILGAGDAGIAWRKRDTEQLLRRGWVTAKLTDHYYHWVRITPAGLRALADAVERYGLPELDRPTSERRECADCGSRRVRYVEVPVESAIAGASA